MTAESTGLSGTIRNIVSNGIVFTPFTGRDLAVATNE
jgi:hypothetical protein